MNPDSPLFLDPEALQQQLWQHIAELQQQPFVAFLQAEGILPRLTREAVISQILSAVTFAPEEQAGVIEQLWQGLGTPPPLRLDDDWLASVDPQQRPLLLERWRELRRQKFLDLTYGKDVDNYFLERRADLEQVVYGMIRLNNVGAAEELYLRLVDDDADFVELARTYSVGDERYTHGLVGPMSISQPHPSIRAVLNSLEVGQIAPPLRIDPWVLILRMEHRQPAQLNEAIRQQLVQELFETDLQPIVQAQLELALQRPVPAALPAATDLPPAAEPEPPPRPGGSAAASADAASLELSTLVSEDVLLDLDAIDPQQPPGGSRIHRGDVSGDVI